MRYTLLATLSELLPSMQSLYYPLLRHLNLTVNEVCQNFFDDDIAYVFRNATEKDKRVIGSGDQKNNVEWQK